MVGRKWSVVLPLLVNFNIVTLQPIAREARHVDPRECCPCPDARASLTDGWPQCPCGPGMDDPEASASMLLPALRAIQPFVKPSDQKTDPKPLLQPEVGLASSVLETLRQATDEEYEEALARDAARSAVQLLESTLDPEDDTIIGTPKNKVRIYLHKEDDEMDDNLPEPSHVQETRCVHSPLQSKHGQLRLNRPTPAIEVFELSPKPSRKLNNKNVLHRKTLDMDNSIGASNIKEQVIQPNSENNSERLHLKSDPALFDLFTQNNFDETEDQKGFQINRSEKSNQNQGIIPKLPSKLREFIDNLEIRKSKKPIIDLKKYTSPVTQIPPLQLNSIEKTTNYKKPLPLKDILKLKDVELIPKNSFIKSNNAKQPPLKLQLENSKINPNVCIEDKSNLVPLINEDSEIITFPTYSDMTDPESSQTFSNPVFDSKNVVNTNMKQDFKPVEGMSNSISSVPIDFEDQGGFDYDEANQEEDSNKEQVLPENCNEVFDNSFMQQLPNDDNQGKVLTDNNFVKGNVQNLEKHNDDASQDETNNETFKVEFLEDFDTPIEVDTSSFIPKSSLKDNDNAHALKENTINDSVADTSNNVLQINDQNNGISDIPQENSDEIVDDCNSLESFAKSSVSKQQSSVEENSMEKLSSEPVNNAHDVLTDINEDPSQVSFQDLQDMSNSILSISECEARDRDLKTNINEVSHETNDDYDISHSPLPTQVFEPISEEIETNHGPDIKSGFNENGKVIEESEANLNENLCKSTTFSDSLSDINRGDMKQTINSDTENSEMRPEASESKPKSYDLSYRNSDEKPSIFVTKTKPGANDISNVDKHSVFLNNIKSKLEGLFSTTEKAKDLTNTPDSDAENSQMRAEASEFEPKSYDHIDLPYRDSSEKRSNFVTKTKAGANDILNVDKYSVFLNNIKSKLEGLFSTTEKTTDLANNLDDNANESSNIKPSLAKADDLNRMQLRKISLPELPRMPLDSFNKKLALPNFVNSPLASNSLNPFNFPNPFEDILDPSSAFTALSDKLRSHTEDTIQNVKETLESTLKDSQNFRLSGPTDIFNFDNHDVLESLSNRRDEMKEKLDAIHLDLNDRFSTFQRNVLDHFNVPDERSVFKVAGNDGRIKSSYKPLRQELALPQESKLRNVKLDHDLLRNRPNALKKHTEIKIMSPKIPTKSLNSDRKLQSSVLYTTTTPIPSFIPRPKVLKTNMGASPRLTDETLVRTRPAKKPLPEQKEIKIKPFSVKPESTNLSDERFGSSSLFSKMNSPLKSFKTKAERQDQANLQKDSPVNDFRKTLLQNRANQKSRLEIPKKSKDLETLSALKNNGFSDTTQELSRMKEGRARSGSRHHEGMVVSPTSHLDTMHPPQRESGLRLVEPMQENVPYKCKLICYRDS